MSSEAKVKRFAKNHRTQRVARLMVDSRLHSLIPIGRINILCVWLAAGGIKYKVGKRTDWCFRVSLPTGIVLCSTFFINTDSAITYLSVYLTLEVAGGWSLESLELHR